MKGGKGHIAGIHKEGNFGLLTKKECKVLGNRLLACKVVCICIFKEPKVAFHSKDDQFLDKLNFS
jgi:hypothetical protein